ncbi:hypothetical protein C8R45DRAFT_924619 [Mycena sanguinolenta]|nr:hypothetical protein C8R45DRAFT_924619 [Mycena sanguinolenta]
MASNATEDWRSMPLPTPFVFGFSLTPDQLRTVAQKWLPNQPNEATSELPDPPYHIALIRHFRKKKLEFTILDICTDSGEKRFLWNWNGVHPKIEMPPENVEKVQKQFGLSSVETRCQIWPPGMTQVKKVLCETNRKLPRFPLLSVVAYGLHIRTTRRPVGPVTPALTRPPDPGHFTKDPGSTAQIPCPPGTSQSSMIFPWFFTAGRTSATVLPPACSSKCTDRRSVASETCPGWAANMTNNVDPVNCTGPTPDSYEGSGDGCFKPQDGTNMLHSLTCAQAADGQCRKNLTDKAHNCPAPPTNSSGANQIRSTGFFVQFLSAV